ncbi:MAG: C39 family peptidase [Bacteroidales bacterium]
MDDLLEGLNDEPTDSFDEDSDSFSNQSALQADGFGASEGPNFENYQQQVVNSKFGVPNLKEAINEELGLSGDKDTDTELDLLATEKATLEVIPYEKNDFSQDLSESQADNLGKIVGYPHNDIEQWHQQASQDTCAIVSQEYVIESFIDVDLTEDQLVDMAIEKGYYSPGGGTLPFDVGNIIEDFGIPVEKTDGNTFEDLIDKLSNNQKVIVGLDASEIWDNSIDRQLEDLFGMPTANHAVQVIGYNSEDQTVILNDPGIPEGKGFEVALSDFTQAWADSHNFMVATVDPAPIAHV